MIFKGRPSGRLFFTRVDGCFRGSLALRAMGKVQEPSSSTKSAATRFAFERSLSAKGVQRIAGVDEAGRGPLAGPVVAAAVILPSTWYGTSVPPELEGLNDSKQLTEHARDRFFEVITHHPEIQWAVASSTVEDIEKINILQATHQAMNQALAGLRPPPQYVLVDGLRVASMTLPQTPIVKGDSLSFSIAAASVVAKVTRDRMMDEYDKQYPGYGFAEHKGYGTPQHMAAIARLGPSAIHRRSFAPFRPVQQELF